MLIAVAVAVVYAVAVAAAQTCRACVAADVVVGDVVVGVGGGSESNRGGLWNCCCSSLLTKVLQPTLVQKYPLHHIRHDDQHAGHS
jgi:hypothetical protein